MNEPLTPHSRSLRPADLERVVEIDAYYAGRSRKLFFKKRLEAALANTKGFIAVATETNTTLTGFAIARLQDGEFGIDRKVAVLDVIGVDPKSLNAGQGTMLLDHITEQAKLLGISEIRTQLDWHDQNLLGFFADQGFLLAPSQVLERAVTKSIEPPTQGGTRN